MRKPAAVLLFAACALGCGDRPDPLARDHHLAARAGERDLAISSLDSLFRSVQPPQPPNLFSAIALATVWTDYHRVAFAAAHDDSLDAGADYAIQPAVNDEKVSLFLQRIRKSVPGDTATEALYRSAGHGLIAVRRIVLRFPPNSTQAQRDSVGRFANTLRKSLQATPSNFSTAARQYSAETLPPTGANFRIVSSREVHPSIFGMVKSMPPDSITIPFGTAAGVEMIQRVSWLDVRAAFAAAYRAAGERADVQQASDLALARADVHILDHSPAHVRDAILDRTQFFRDTTALAAYDRDGSFNIREMMDWIDAAPEAENLFFSRGVEHISDDKANNVIETLLTRSILLRSADSAGITVPDSLRAAFKHNLGAERDAFWKWLGVSPSDLHARGGSVKEREAMAAARVDELIRARMSTTGVLAPVPPLLRRALDARYPGIISVRAIKVWLKIT